MEPKILPPTIRSNKRYIVFKIISENKKLAYSDVHNAIWNNVIDIFGEIGASESKIWFIKNLYSEETQLGIIKCSHKFVEKLRLCLTFIKIIGETRVVVSIEGVSGTIKSAKNKYAG